MVIRSDEKEEKPKTKKEEKTEVKEEVEQGVNNIPMIPNYLDLILGEVNAIRVMLENKEK